MSTLENTLNNPYVQSLIAIVCIIGVNQLLLKSLKRKIGQQADKKFIINSIEKSTAFIIALVMIFIWFAEIKTFALSIAAFIVAIVIATREYIQCILGAIYLSTSRMFTLGDWIEVNGKEGEVVKSDWLSTTLFEIDSSHGVYSYTGKTLTLPNSTFINHSVKNLNFMRRYITHQFSIIVEPDDYDVSGLKAYLLERAHGYCDEFQEVASRYNALIEKRLGVNIHGPEAKVSFVTTETAKFKFSICIFCPTEQAQKIEQNVIDDFMRCKTQFIIGSENNKHLSL